MSVRRLLPSRPYPYGLHRRERPAYSVTLPWQVLNARDYGVPQDRQRLFLLGAKGVETPRYPLPAILSQPTTCRDALDDLPNAEDFDALMCSDTVRVELNTAGMSA